MFYNSLRRKINVSFLILISCILLTVFFIWFAINNYLSARPIAQAILKGLAFSIKQTIENMCERDKSFESLNSFRYRDVAYFAIIDKNGTIKFHQNPELIGEQIEDKRYVNAFSSPEPLQDYVRLGTGEIVFEVHLPIKVKEDRYILRLALHTWQADQIINRAKTGATILLSVLTGAWILGLLLIKMFRREVLLKEQIAKKSQMAKLGELGAVLAHEVRNPLAGIKGYAQLLHEKISDERLKNFSNLIVQEAIRLEGLVNDLLDYVRNDDPADGTTCINKELLLSIWNIISEREKVDKIKFDLFINREVCVKCHKEKFWQLMINLFINAVQAIQQEGVVSVRVTEKKGVVEITIKDTGPGFTEEAIKKAFEPFFTTRPRGCGLGLAVCHKIVERCGGKIRAENAEEGGAIITITLPVIKIIEEKI